MLALGLALIPLSIAARQNPLATAGPQIAIAVPFAAVGLVIARNRLGNAIGWLMLCLAAGLMFYAAAGLYNVISYGLGHRLPFAAAVLLGFQVSGPVLGLLPLVILVFPGGRLPSPRWRWVLRVYLATALVDMAAQTQMGA